jgi:hypothetical protein
MSDEILDALESYVNAVEKILDSKRTPELYKAQNMRPGEKYFKVRLKKVPRKPGADKWTSQSQIYHMSAEEYERRKAEGQDVEIVEGDYPTEMKDILRGFKIGMDALVKHIVFKAPMDESLVGYKNKLKLICSMLYYATGGNRDEALKLFAHYYIHDVFTGHSNESVQWTKEIKWGIKKNLKKFPKQKKHLTKFYYKFVMPSTFRDAAHFNVAMAEMNKISFNGAIKWMIKKEV